MVIIKNSMLTAAVSLLTISNQVDARMQVQKNLTKAESFDFTNARRDGNRANVYKKA